METRSSAGAPRIQDDGAFPVNVYCVIRVGRRRGRRRRMARDSDQLAGFENENTGGLLTGFLADEDVFDRRALWRLGSWGAVSVGAVIVALYANQSSIALRREQVAAADLARQAQQIQVGCQAEPERGATAGVRDRHAQRRPRPAVHPRHDAGTGAGFGDRRDYPAECRRAAAAGRTRAASCRPGRGCGGRAAVGGGEEPDARPHRGAGRNGGCRDRCENNRQAAGGGDSAGAGDGCVSSKISQRRGRAQSAGRATAAPADGFEIHHGPARMRPPPN